MKDMFLFLDSSLFSFIPELWIYLLRIAKGKKCVSSFVGCLLYGIWLQKWFKHSFHSQVITFFFKQRKISNQISKLSIFFRHIEKNQHKRCEISWQLPKGILHIPNSFSKNWTYGIAHFRECKGPQSMCMQIAQKIGEGFFHRYTFSVWRIYAYSNRRWNLLQCCK